MNIFKRVWRDFSKRVIHDNRGIWPALAFLANPAFWSGVSKVLPMVAGMMNKGGSGGGGLLGGQAQQQQQPQNQFIPGQLQPFRQMPSYGALIQEMLSKYRGF